MRWLRATRQDRRVVSRKGRWTQAVSASAAIGRGNQLTLGQAIGGRIKESKSGAGAAARSVPSGRAVGKACASMPAAIGSTTTNGPQQAAESQRGTPQPDPQGQPDVAPAPWDDALFVAAIPAIAVIAAISPAAMCWQGMAPAGLPSAAIAARSPTSGLTARETTSRTRQAMARDLITGKAYRSRGGTR